MDCNIYFFWCFTEGERGGWSGWNWVIDKETKRKKFRQKARYFNRLKRKQDKKSWEGSQKIYLIHCSLNPVQFYTYDFVVRGYSFFCCIPACYLGLSFSLYSSCPQLDQLKTFLKASQACLTRWVTFSGSRGTSPTCQGQSSGGLKIPFSGPPPHLLPTSPPLRIRQFGDINPFQGRQGEEETTISIAFSFFFKYLSFLFQFSPNSSHKEARWNWNQEHPLCWWDGLFHSWVKVKTLWCLS